MRTLHISLQANLTNAFFSFQCCGLNSGLCDVRQALYHGVPCPSLKANFKVAECYFDKLRQVVSAGPDDIVLLKMCH